jgi:hypothetical protein
MEQIQMMRISRPVLVAALFAAGASSIAGTAQAQQMAPFTLAISGFELMGENCPDRASTQVVLAGTPDRQRIQILFPGAEGNPAMTPGFTVMGADAVSSCSVAISLTQMGVPKIDLRVVSARANVVVNNPGDAVSVTARFRVNNALSAPRTGTVMPVMADPMTADTAPGQLGEVQLNRINVSSEVMMQGTLTVNLELATEGGTANAGATMRGLEMETLNAVDVAG